MREEWSVSEVKGGEFDAVDGSQTTPEPTKPSWKPIEDLGSSLSKTGI